MTIEPLVRDDDQRPVVGGKFNSIDSLEWLDSGDVIFAAGGRRGNANAVGLFAVGTQGLTLRLTAPIAQVGKAPFTNVQAVPGVDWAANGGGLLAFDAKFAAQLYKYDTTVGGAASKLTFGLEQDVTDIPSGVTGDTFEGQFSGRGEGVAVSEPGEIFFAMDFGGGGINPFLNGVFVSKINGDLCNIAYEDDPMPGSPPIIMNVFFENFGTLQTSNNGNLYFEAKLDGTVNAGNDDTFWRCRSSAPANDRLELLIREGNPAPGLVDPFKVFPMFLRPGVGDQVVFNGLASDGQGTVLQANWLGTGPGDFAPFAITSPDVGYQATVEGQNQDVYFTELRPSFDNIQVSPTGDIFFSAVAGLQSAAGTPVAGIWKIDANTRAMSLLVRETDTFHSLFVLDTNASGQFALWASLGNFFPPKDSIWLAEADGTLTKVVAVDDQLENRTVRSLDLSEVRLNAAGALVFIAEFGTGLNNDRESIFLAQPSRDFLWSGDAGDRDWHTTLNWDDKASGVDATVSPGDGGGTENVEINLNNVTVADRPVNIRSIESSGSLTVNQPLTIAVGGEIENLMLVADLTVGNTLGLTGETGRWQSGRISGTGPLTLEDGSKFTIEAAGASALELAAPVLIDEMSDLLKIGAGDVQIQGRFEQRGGILPPADGEPVSDTHGIRIEGGKVTLSGGGLFDFAGDPQNETIVIVVDGGELTLEGAEPFEFRAPTVFSASASGGTVGIEAPISFSTLGVGANTAWRSGNWTQLAESGAGVIVGPVLGDGVQSVAFDIVGQRSIGGNSLLTVGTAANVNQEGDLTFSGRGAVVLSGGEYRLKGDLDLGEDGRFSVGGRSLLNLFNDPPPTSRLIAEGPALVREVTGAIKMSPGGTVETTSLVILSLVSDGTGATPLESVGPGRWVLADNSRVELDGNSAIASIPKGVELQLGDEASFNNLPFVTGNFSVEKGGTLVLRKTFFLVTDGDFINRGRLVLGGEPSELDVSNGQYLGTPSSSLEGSGKIDGSVVLEGKFVPGESPGTVTVDGDFEQTANGVLELEIGGVASDQVVVTGTARLAGQLVLAGIEGYFPTDGTQLQVLTANVIEGEFDRVTAARPSGRQHYDVAVGNGSVTLTANRFDPTTYEEWKAGVFTPAEQADPTISGALANPDHDSLLNLFEYVYDRRPKEIDLEPLETEVELNAEGRAESVIVSFPWADGMTDATYQVEESTDLENWSPVAGGLTVVDQGVIDIVSLEVATGGIVESSYFRLSVELN